MAEQLQQAALRLDQTISEVLAERASVKRQIEGLEQAVASSKTDLTYNRERIIVLDTRLAGLDQRLAALEAQRNVLQQRGVHAAIGVDQLLSAAVLPKLTYPDQLSRSPAPSVKARQPPGVAEWRGFQGDAFTWQEKTCEALRGTVRTDGKWVRLMSSFQATQGMSVVYEDAIYAYYELVVLPAVAVTFEALGTQLRFRRCPLEDFAIWEDNGSADLSAANDARKVLVEIKDKFKLPFDSLLTDYDRLRADANKNAKNKDKTPVEKIIEQLYGYMTLQGRPWAQYAVLCTDEALWAARLVPGEDPSAPQLQVSQPVLRDSRNPSFLGAMCYLVHCALSAPPMGPPAPAAGVPRPAINTMKAEGKADNHGGTPLGWFASLQDTFKEAVVLASCAMGPVTLTVDQVALGDAIATGRTGRVYCGRYNGVPVAVKIPVGSRGQELSESIKQLRYEAEVYKVLEPLQGVFVPRLCAHGTLMSCAGDSFTFIATEMLEGSVTWHEADHDPTFPAHALVSASTSAWQGLLAMHALGVAHADVRAANCIVTRDGKAVWIDFAFAVLHADSSTKAQDLRDASRFLLLASTPVLHAAGHVQGPAGDRHIEYMNFGNGSTVADAVPVSARFVSMGHEDMHSAVDTWQPENADEVAAPGTADEGERWHGNITALAASGADRSCSRDVRASAAATGAGHGRQRQQRIERRAAVQRRQHSLPRAAAVQLMAKKPLQRLLRRI